MSIKDDYWDRAFPARALFLGGKAQDPDRLLQVGEVVQDQETTGLLGSPISRSNKDRGKRADTSQRTGKARTATSLPTRHYITVASLDQNESQRSSVDVPATVLS